MAEVHHEPSMEEILASIRRIIAEDGEEAPAPSTTRRQRAPRTLQSAPAAEAGEGGEAGDAAPEEVLELTDKIDDLSAAPDQPEPEPEGHDAPLQPSYNPLHPDAAREEPAPVPLPELELTSPVAPTSTPTPQPATIVSQETEQASRSALAQLSALVVKPESNADNTLEGLVREMLRPMLREWLDAKLPALVETMVQKEIARITGGIA